MFNKYLNDYYTFKIDVQEIVKKESLTVTTFNRWLKRNGLTPRQKWFDKIDTGNKELDKVLHDRYIFMLKRCKYKRNDRYERYKSLDYMPVYDYVEFCNENKKTLIILWSDYINSGRNPKYAISLDRIDNEIGYVLGNIEFVIHGFNSWKRSVLPIKVIHENKTDYFMTKEEASIFYGLRKQTIGEIYNKKPYHMKGYEVADSSIGEVLKEKGFKTLFEYYQEIH